MSASVPQTRYVKSVDPLPPLHSYGRILTLICPLSRSDLTRGSTPTTSRPRSSTCSRAGGTGRGSVRHDWPGGPTFLWKNISGTDSPSGHSRILIGPCAPEARSPLIWLPTPSQAPPHCTTQPLFLEQGYDEAGDAAPTMSFDWTKEGG